MNYKTALAEQIDDMAQELESRERVALKLLMEVNNLKQELADSLLTNAELSVEIKQLKEEV
jgi:regulator of replication initiation timing